MATHNLGTRIARLEAIRAIRQRQSQFGRLLARPDPAAAAACFLPDATIEIGASGVFVGRRRIQAALTRLVGAEGPSSPGGMPNLAMHAQIMPIIVVGPTGDHAMATWRDLDTGARNGSAYWADGVVLTSYRLTPTGWMLASLRWERTIHVPFDGGWRENADACPPLGIEPDRPTTHHVPVWPNVPSEPLELEPRLAPVGDEAPEHADADVTPSHPDDAVLARVESLERTFEISYLVSRLGYAFDDADWERFADQLSDDVVVRLGTRAIRRRTAVLAALRAICNDRDTEGRLLETVLFEPEITFDNGRARVTVRFFSQWTAYGIWHELGVGTCDIEFTRVATGWSITRLDASDAQFTPYDRGWAKHRSTNSRLARAERPAPVTQPPEGSAGVTRTAAAWPIAAPNGDCTTDPALPVEQRLRRLESLVEIEQTQYAYGYHLSSLAWDQLTELFTDDGTIEIAHRGIYRGRPSIRRSFDLYGAGPEDGVLHSHLQFQLIVELSSDGSHATVRARAFSMLGRYRSSAMWTAGRYRNEYARLDRFGPWRIAVDHLVNRYFAPYEVGWKDIPHRDPPGPSETSPPDAPSTERFSLYPH
ncbi:hypothetical protein GCM10011490_15170 [Pseudoclavibacter endophyticus]|uniref:SnoaL-like domain-containing protein n=1 Tax=Pseudoclavibacter endophyticus TaxID=1778590 RepID=A0A6H9WQN1_9MICO|nr:nuclear transport factor 2 family protein [Pseudoclavibacter endophyticus]KAB1649095.1 hypothetical protein F8O04_02095 [Pseudoclavibacter endophyticus]GGA65488.1 hypothetical protein GCM10011490_15170 [Pseudoclavibacter endophyticus]